MPDVRDRHEGLPDELVLLMRTIVINVYDMNVCSDFETRFADMAEQFRATKQRTTSYLQALHGRARKLFDYRQFPQLLKQFLYVLDEIEADIDAMIARLETGLRSVEETVNRPDFDSLDEQVKQQYFECLENTRKDVESKMPELLARKEVIAKLRQALNKQE
jgi:deoxyadenosine/deoxycytidine kinase